MRQLIRGTPRDSSGGHSDAPHRAFTPARARSRSQTQHGLPRAPRARRRADAPVGNGRRGEHMHARQGPPRCGSRRRADARSSRRNQRSSEVIRGHQRSSDARSSRRSRSTNEACHQAGGAAPASCPAADAAGCQSCQSAIRSSWSAHLMRQSEAIRGNQRQSEAIRGNQSAIRSSWSAHPAKDSSSRVWHLVTPWAGRPGVGAIRCTQSNQVHSEALRGTQMQTWRRSEGSRSNQTQSDAIRRNQTQ